MTTASPKQVRSCVGAPSERRRSSVGVPSELLGAASELLHRSFGGATSRVGAAQLSVSQGEERGKLKEDKPERHREIDPRRAGQGGAAPGIGSGIAFEARRSHAAQHHPGCVGAASERGRSEIGVAGLHRSLRGCIGDSTWTAAKS